MLSPLAYFKILCYYIYNQPKVRKTMKKIRIISFVICILMTVNSGTAVLMGELSVVEILITVFSVLCFVLLRYSLTDEAPKNK